MKYNEIKMKKIIIIIQKLAAWNNQYHQRINNSHHGEILMAA